MLPFGDWRGTFVGGTTAQGVKLPCDATYCLVAWPGKRYRAFLERDRPVHQQNFFGSLTTGQENSNGLMYMRNRYYNPLTGAFTQDDPIGLAGGLNTYGYAEGNPVTYSDPYGLAAEAGCPPICNDSNLRHLELEVERAQNATAGEAAFGALVMFGVSAIALAPEALPALSAGARRIWRGVRSEGDAVFRTAQEGGKHAGFLRNYAGRSARELRSTVRSLQRGIREHEAFLRDPASHVRNWSELRPQHQQSLLRHWRKEIQSSREQIQIIERLQ